MNEEYLNIPTSVCEMIEQQLEEDKHKEVLQEINKNNKLKKEKYELKLELEKVKKEKLNCVLGFME